MLRRNLASLNESLLDGSRKTLESVAQKKSVVFSLETGGERSSLESAVRSPEEAEGIEVLTALHLKLLSNYDNL